MMRNTLSMDKKELIRRISTIETDLRRFGIRSLWVFGSAVENELSPGSDIDVLYEFEPGCETLLNWMAAKELLEDTFDRSVDLVSKEFLNPHMKDRVLGEMERVLPPPREQIDQPV